jgi:hypothetical protein
MKTIVCSADKIKSLLDLKKAGKIGKLTTIIYFDDASEADIAAAGQAGTTLIKYTEILKEGKDLEV